MKHIAGFPAHIYIHIHFIFIKFFNKNDIYVGGQSNIIHQYKCNERASPFEYNISLTFW